MAQLQTYQDKDFYLKWQDKSSSIIREATKRPLVTLEKLQRFTTQIGESTTGQLLVMHSTILAIMEELQKKTVVERKPYELSL